MELLAFSRDESQTHRNYLKNSSVEYENYNLLLDTNCTARNTYTGKLFSKWWDELNMNDANDWLTSMKIDFYWKLNPSKISIYLKKGCLPYTVCFKIPSIIPIGERVVIVISSLKSLIKKYFNEHWLKNRHNQCISSPCRPS